MSGRQARLDPYGSHTLPVTDAARVRRARRGLAERLHVARSVRHAGTATTGAAGEGADA